MVPRRSKKKDGQMEVGSFGPRLIYSEHGSVSLSIAPIDVAYNAGAFRRPAPSGSCQILANCTVIPNQTELNE